MGDTINTLMKRSVFLFGTEPYETSEENEQLLQILTEMNVYISDCSAV